MQLNADMLDHIHRNRCSAIAGSGEGIRPHPARARHRPSPPTDSSSVVSLKIGHAAAVAAGLTQAIADREHASQASSAAVRQRPTACPKPSIARQALQRSVQRIAADTDVLVTGIRNNHR